jgi:hypothetical protein
LRPLLKKTCLKLKSIATKFCQWGSLVSFSDFYKRDWIYLLFRLLSSESLQCIVVLTHSKEKTCTSNL